jgi:hypothetical protein
MIEGVGIFFVQFLQISHKSILFWRDIALVDKEVGNPSVLVFQRLNFWKLVFELGNLRSPEGQKHGILSGEGFSTASAVDGEELIFFDGSVF